jgi:hypothetical protein
MQIGNDTSARSATTSSTNSQREENNMGLVFKNPKTFLEDAMPEVLHELMDQIDTGDYTENFDLKIEWNGQTLQLPMHADLYSRLERLLQEEVEENKL